MRCEAPEFDLLLIAEYSVHDEFYKEIITPWGHLIALPHGPMIHYTLEGPKEGPLVSKYLHHLTLSQLWCSLCSDLSWSHLLKDLQPFL